MPRRNSTRPTNGAGYAPVSLGTGIRANSRTPPMVMEGTDRLGVVNWEGALPTGSVLFNLMITAGIFKSLRDAAKTRQYIQWHHLSFKLACGTNTAKDGSYVAAFVADPEDELNEDPELAVEEVAGAPGMIQDSIWRTRTVEIWRGGRNNTGAAIVDPTKFGHYTSTQGEPRFFSPGYLRVLVDGAVGQAGTMVLYCSYKVTLHVQARQTDSEEVEVPRYRTTVNAFVKSGNNRLEFNSSNYLNWARIFPGYEKPEEDVWFKTDAPLLMCSGKDATSLTRYYIYSPYVCYGHEEDTFNAYPLPGMKTFIDGSIPAAAKLGALEPVITPSSSGIFYQAIPAGSEWEAVDVSDEEETRSKVLGSIRTLPSGGCTNVPPKSKLVLKKIK